MPAVEVAGLKQLAVLWPFLRHDSQGDPVVSSPIEIPARWEKGVQLALETEEGTVTVSGEVMTDREIAVGSIMRLGPIAGMPATPDHLAEVVDYDETPDIKAKVYQRGVRVRRWRQLLPEVVS